jgi:hypothetical protein
VLSAPICEPLKMDATSGTRPSLQSGLGGLFG